MPVGGYPRKGQTIVLFPPTGGKVFCGTAVDTSGAFCYILPTCVLRLGVVVLPEKLVEILACPFCKSEVDVEETCIRCRNEACGLVFPIREGIPVFLVEEAEKPCPKCGAERNFGNEELACPSCRLSFRPSNSSGSPPGKR